MSARVKFVAYLVIIFSLAALQGCKELNNDAALEKKADPNEITVFFLQRGQSKIQTKYWEYSCAVNDKYMQHSTGLINSKEYSALCAKSTHDFCRKKKFSQIWPSWDQLKNDLIRKHRTNEGNYACAQYVGRRVDLENLAKDVGSATGANFQDHVWNRRAAISIGAAETSSVKASKRKAAKEKKVQKTYQAPSVDPNGPGQQKGEYLLGRLEEKGNSICIQRYNSTIKRIMQDPSEQVKKIQLNTIWDVLQKNRCI
jgi:hypothetical protein